MHFVFMILSHRINVLNLTNECLQKLLPTAQLLLSLIRKKHIKHPLDLVRKNYLGKYF